MDTVKIEKGHTRMIAHRGVSGIELENTASAFIAAANRGYYGIETDIRITSDGQFVCFHDETTKRLSELQCVIAATEYAALKDIPLRKQEGATFRSDYRIPLFSDYIDICKTYGKFAVTEIKFPFCKADIDRLLAAADKQDYFSKVIFISFDFDVLAYIKQRRPDASVQFLTDIYSQELIKRLCKHGMGVDIQADKLSASNVASFKNAGITVNCWTCNDVEYAGKLDSWGVDFITTDILE